MKLAAGIIAAGACVAPLAVFALAGGVVLMVGGQGQASALGAGMACATEGVAITAQDAAGRELTLSEAQVANAAVIITVGQPMGREAQVIALMTALQESTMRNLANSSVPESLDLPHEGQGSDHDSVGLFQQRPSMGWGTVAEIMDPATSAGTFYERLAGVAGWEQMRPGQAAQAVQRSAFPDAYDRWEPVAHTLVSALSSVQCSQSSAPQAPVTGVEGARGAIVSFALQQVGDRYVWAAEGPDAWDCSGLVQAAYAQAGVRLEHSSGAQRHAGVEVPASQARPGDVLWWPGHVAIYLGGGRMVGAQSPAEGVREMAVYGSPVYIRVIE